MQFYCICLIGDCGAGKSTLAISTVLLGRDFGEVQEADGLTYYYSPTFFYPGAVFGEVAAIGPANGKNASTYLHIWREMTPRPPVFIVDGDSLCKLDVLEELQKEGVAIKVVDVSVPDDEKANRCVIIEHQCPNK